MGARRPAASNFSPRNVIRTMRNSCHAEAERRRRQGKTGTPQLRGQATDGGPFSMAGFFLTKNSRNFARRQEDRYGRWLGSGAVVETGLWEDRVEGGNGPLEVAEERSAWVRMGGSWLLPWRPPSRSDVPLAPGLAGSKPKVRLRPKTRRNDAGNCVPGDWI